MHSSNHICHFPHTCNPLEKYSNYNYNIQPKFGSGTPEKARLGARIAELSQNPSLRTDPWSLILGGVHPKLALLVGCVPLVWEGGKRIDGDSVLKGLNVWYNQATPLMQRACANAVGARKVVLIPQFIYLRY
jgi:hypothetical protein